MVLPMYMLAKKSADNRVGEITDYITGVEHAKHCVAANTPVVNGEVDNKLPDGAKFKWLGWDYIRENDIAKLEVENEKTFMKYWNEYHKNTNLFK